MNAAYQTYDSDQSTPQAQLAVEETRIRIGLKAFHEVGEALKNIEDRELYKLKHSTFEEYCQSVWHIGYRHARYLINAASTYKKILEAGCEVKPTHATQLRDIATLPDQEIIDVWRNASSGGRVPTQKEVQKERDRQQVIASPYHHIANDMTADRIAPNMAVAIVAALDSVKPGVCMEMVRLNVREPSLIREMDRIAGSDTYQTICKSGYIQFNDSTGVAVEEAKPFHLKRALDEARQVHIQSSPGAVLYIPTFPKNPEKTLKNLKAYLADSYTDLAKLIKSETEAG